VYATPDETVTGDDNETVPAVAVIFAVCAVIELEVVTVKVAEVCNHGIVAVVE
jgi:hypothetical protein